MGVDLIVLCRRARPQEADHLVHAFHVHDTPLQGPVVVGEKRGKWHWIYWTSFTWAWPPFFSILNNVSFPREFISLLRMKTPSMDNEMTQGMKYIDLQLVVLLCTSGPGQVVCSPLQDSLSVTWAVTWLLAPSCHRTTCSWPRTPWLPRTRDVTTLTWKVKINLHHW